MKYLKIITLLSLSSLLFTSSNWPLNRYDLEVVIVNIQEIKGKLDIALYNRADVFLEKGGPLLKKYPSVSSRTIKIHLQDLQEGEYGISLFHDVNNNGKFDTNRLGVPIEPFGFSNNPRLFMRPPSFNQVRIQLCKHERIFIYLRNA